MKRVLNGGLNRDISSRILKATASSDPLEVAHVIPGPEPLRSVWRAASRKNVDRRLISEAGDAVRRFDLFIPSEAGTRRVLDAIISASLPNARERFELASKQAVFKGVSQLKGVQAETWLSSTLIHPAADDPARHDVALLHGALSMQRLRPGVTVKFTYRELVVPDDDEGEPSEEEAPLLGSLKVDQFFINPPARLDAHQTGKVMNYTLVEDCLGSRAVADMLVVDHHPAALDRYVSPGPRRKKGTFVTADSCGTRRRFCPSPGGRRGHWQASNRSSCQSAAQPRRTGLTSSPDQQLFRVRGRPAVRASAPGSRFSWHFTCSIIPVALLALEVRVRLPVQPGVAPV